MQENMFSDQELFRLVIISFLLMTFMCDSDLCVCLEKLDAGHS